MDRHARKRFANKISNTIWSAAMFILLAAVAIWVLKNWVIPWVTAFNDAV